ncbi:organic solvent ABC transporter permease [Marinobacter bohaiensis]|uniref:organic solvent ABC transporter permease n=1 Tax=Marinobacter bohaiensis TaxID=2201898 RepID=UPI001D179DF7|nr:organic solvent ABC transporter permease [Marinobacter bohaiensis]
MPRTHRSLTLLAASLWLAGCMGGDSSSDSDDDTSRGQVMPSGVQGLTYQTRSQSGTTHAAGRFRYYPGETIDFSIGNLTLASDVPASRMVTPLAFFAEARSALTGAIADDLGLLSHKPVEQQVMDTPAVQNTVRLMLALDEDGTAAEGEPLVFSDRVIRQLNAALPALAEPIDVHQSVNAFADPDVSDNSLSPVNQLLAAICFYPEGDELCEEPPSQAEIDAAPEPPPQSEARDPDIDYSDELQNRRNRILNAVRSIEDVELEDVDDYLIRELDAITTERTNRYYLSTVTANIPASDTAIREVFVRRAGGEVTLDNIEALSTDPGAVVVHAASAQTHSVEYFVDGRAGDESDLIVNFRPAGDYRWLRKPLRVVIE